MTDENIQEIKILEKEREKIVEKAKKNGHKDGELIFKYLDETDYYIWNTISNKITKLKTLTEVEKIIERGIKLASLDLEFRKGIEREDIEQVIVDLQIWLKNKLGEMKK